MTRQTVPSGVAWLRRVTTWGVAGLAVAGFAMSYDALHALARTEGVSPSLAWAWPLVVDGFIVLASLAVVHAILEHRSTAYPWLLVLAFSTVSVGFNVAHAHTGLLAHLVAAVPPLALVLAFELLMRQLRSALDAPSKPRRPRTRPPSPAPAPVPRRSASVAASQASRLQGVALRDHAARILTTRADAGQPVSGALLGRELGVSESYGRRLLRELQSTDRSGGPSPMPE